MHSAWFWAGDCAFCSIALSLRCARFSILLRLNSIANVTGFLDQNHIHWPLSSIPAGCSLFSLSFQSVFVMQHSIINNQQWTTFLLSFSIAVFAALPPQLMASIQIRFGLVYEFMNLKWHHSNRLMNTCLGRLPFVLLLCSIFMWMDFRMEQKCERKSVLLIPDWTLIAFSLCSYRLIIIDEASSSPGRVINNLLF